MDKLIGKNSKGEIVELYSGLWCDNKDLIEIISIPHNFINLSCECNQLTSLPNLPENLINLYCEENNIKQLPNLRELQKLKEVCCDIQCFEPYMLEMENIHFEFFC